MLSKGQFKTEQFASSSYYFLRGSSHLKGITLVYLELHAYLLANALTDNLTAIISQLSP